MILIDLFFFINMNNFFSKKIKLSIPYFTTKCSLSIRKYTPFQNHFKSHCRVIFFALVIAMLY